MNVYLVCGVASFLLSFVIHQYFIQFIVMGVFLLAVYVVKKNSQDVGDLKTLIERHNDLLKKEIEELRK